ncbi:MAG: hypothetical protein LUH40_02180 [Clostridiales bacterium]|nr:hypothetical protein [Clostridiales bacterium]
MRRKRIISCLLSLCSLTLCLAGFSSCEAQTSLDEGEQIFADALALTAEQTVFYWEETVSDGDNSYFRQVSSYAEKDNEGNILLDDEGEYKSRKIQVIENVNQKTVLEIYCGLSEAKDKSDSVNMLFLTEYDENQNVVNELTREMTAREFYESGDFEEYLPVNVLSELYGMDFSDMDFDFEDGGITSKGYVAEITFRPTGEYLDRYEEETGKGSMFANADKVFVEISYGRIASLVVYSEKQISGSSLTYEQEDYCFQIVYLGPKFDVPKH